ncbi:MAG: 1-acylglycerol-3-phosphate O-acyltransferase [Candidatus Dasytiphilus stammeri]
MLLILRVIIVIIYSLIVCLFGSIWCLFSPRNPRHVATFSHIFGYLSILFGIHLEIRQPKGIKKIESAIYIANHQNNYDMITAANIIPDRTVMLGKKSLLWIPFFGPLYWLTGNMLIDRSDRAAYKTLTELVRQCQQKKVSIWIFPEGTRSHGRGLLPFKNGAFYAAITVGVPIIPICISNLHNKINLNRLYNGLVIIEMLSPICTTPFNKSQVRVLTKYCHELMEQKIQELNIEASKINAIE